jgi:hypothetical protein
MEPSAATKAARRRVSSESIARASRLRLFLCPPATSENGSTRAVEALTDSLARFGSRVISHPSWRRTMRVY